LIFWSVTVITGLAGTYNIDAIQMAIWKAQAKLVYESRTTTWGSPRFFKNESTRANLRHGSCDRNGGLVEGGSCK
ncbi:MAG TPA: hypothetical protein VN132_08920, partial [Bdellovibrio sp.]|nr:hypothetical protein [Bdellovibrio sp.]